MLVENEMQYSIDPGGVECEFVWNRKFIFVESLISETAQHITYDPSGVGIAFTAFFFYRHATPLGSALHLRFFFYRHSIPLGSVVMNDFFGRLLCNLNMYLEKGKSKFIT